MTMDAKGGKYQLPSFQYLRCGPKRIYKLFPGFYPCNGICSIPEGEKAPGNCICRRNSHGCAVFEIRIVRICLISPRINHVGYKIISAHISLPVTGKEQQS